MLRRHASAMRETAVESGAVTPHRVIKFLHVKNRNGAPLASLVKQHAHCVRERKYGLRAP